MLVMAHFKLYLTEGLNIHKVENDSCDFLYVCRINLVNQLNQFFIFYLSSLGFFFTWHLRRDVVANFSLGVSRLNSMFNEHGVSQTQLCMFL